MINGGGRRPERRERISKPRNSLSAFPANAAISLVDAPFDCGRDRRRLRNGNAAPIYEKPCLKLWLRHYVALAILYSAQCFFPRRTIFLSIL